MPWEDAYAGSGREDAGSALTGAGCAAGELPVTTPPALTQTLHGRERERGREDEKSSAAVVLTICRTSGV
jgi:hypothetical protein